MKYSGFQKSNQGEGMFSTDQDQAHLTFTTHQLGANRKVKGDSGSPHASVIGHWDHIMCSVQSNHKIPAKVTDANWPPRSN